MRTNSEIEKDIKDGIYHIKEIIGANIQNGIIQQFAPARVIKEINEVEQKIILAAAFDAKDVLKILLETSLSDAFVYEQAYEAAKNSVQNSFENCRLLRLVEIKMASEALRKASIAIMKEKKTLKKGESES